MCDQHVSHYSKSVLEVGWIGSYLWLLDMEITVQLSEIHYFATEIHLQFKVTHVQYALV